MAAGLEGLGWLELACAGAVGADYVLPAEQLTSGHADLALR